MAPIVSVIMPVYNTAPYLKEAIDSILNQTFQYFELLIFDDNSTDGSAEIIASYTDERIRVCKSEKRAKGTWVTNLNEGLDLARGRYVTRMDSDDISPPERFAKQVAFLDQHPEIGLCSGHMKMLGAVDHFTERPSTHEVIRHRLLSINPIVGALAMLRRDILNANNLRFNESFLVAQDTELWMRFIHVAKVHIIPDILYIYRQYPQQNTSRRRNFQLEKGIENKINYVKSWGIYLSAEEEDSARYLFGNHFENPTREQLFKVHETGEKIIERLMEKGFQEELLRPVFNYHYYRLLYTLPAFNASLIPLFFSSAFSDVLPLKDKIKLTVKCLVKWAPEKRQKQSTNS